MSISSRMLRLLFRKGDKRRDRGLETLQSIERFDNISYGKHGKWNLLDVYRPKNERRFMVVRKGSCSMSFTVISEIKRGRYVIRRNAIFSNRF